MLLDTNILILFSKGDQQIIKNLKKINKRFISFISYIEFLADLNLTKKERETAKKFLTENFNIVNLDEKILNKTIEVRIKSSLKLPDAIIVATALILKEKIYTLDKTILKKYPDLKFK
jgi:hypothetical protein